MKKTILSILTTLSVFASGADKPNIIIIYTDDQGYGDLSCYGGTHVDTPRIDQMAQEGVKLTNFYMAAAVCTPSRAALLTGSYPVRTGMTGVLLANDKRGLHPDEITMAEMLKSKGYQTALVGKWHLGDHQKFLPIHQGFDEFFGIPYSHDIHPYHPNQEHYNFPPLPLIQQDKVIEEDPNADFLTKRFTEKAVDFIERNKEEPFFLYLAHPMPHLPVHASATFTKSVNKEVLAKIAKEDGYIDYDTRNELFRPCISEIDWSVGQVLDTLEKAGITENTIVIFTTDNGPVVGNAGPLRGKKGSLFDGGSRVPGIIKWPAGIKPGQVNDEIISAMDLFPTFAHIVGAEIPQDRKIDGKDILPVLQDGAKSPHEALFYHRGKHLCAVRSGDWKLMVVDFVDRKRVDGVYTLYNLKDDIGERVDVKDQHPEVVERLKAYAKAFRDSVELHKREIGSVE